jgi:hypothetical protein
MDERRSRLVAALVANAAPLAGVLALGWSLAALVVVYWLELAVGLALAAVRALFAQRPPEHDPDVLVLGALRGKRGRVPVPLTGLEIHVATVPVLAVLVPVFGAAWLVTGGTALAGVEATTAGDPFDDAAVGTAAAGVLAVIAVRGVETVRYFRDGAYETDTVQSALLTAAWPVMVVGLALVGSGAAALAGAPAAVVLTAVVVAKSGLEVGAAYRDRVIDSLPTADRSEPPPERPPVDARLSGPVATVRPRPAAVLIDGVLRGLRTTTAVFVAALAVLALVVAGLTGSVGLALLVGGLAGAALTGLAALGVLDRTMRYLPMEYRVGEDVVGYDRLLRTAQWRAPSWTVARCEPERTAVDRLFGTHTLVVEHEGRSLRLPHLADTAALIGRPAAAGE